MSVGYVTRPALSSRQSQSAVPAAGVLELIETTVNGEGPLTGAIQSALADALALRGKLTEETLAIKGMSGRKFRFFLNNLIERIPDPRYLEIGSWQGSTFCSAIKGNRVTAVAIDDWSQFGGPVAQFFGNLSAHASQEARTSVLMTDFRAVKFDHIGTFNVYFYDGPHKYRDQYEALALALPALAEEFVFIVDDWNHPPVRQGTASVVRDLGLTALHEVTIRTTVDDTQPALRNEQSDWHNGCYIAVLRTPGADARPATS